MQSEAVRQNVGAGASLRAALVLWRRCDPLTDELSVKVTRGFGSERGNTDRK